MGPDLAKSIYLSSGCIVPLGSVINYDQQAGAGGFGMRNNLQHNEFIVYDTTQVRIKYVIELRDQNQ